MLEITNEMEKICLDAGNTPVSPENVSRISELNGIVHDDFIKYYTKQEDIMFPELEKVLPSPTSTNSMRNEHREILTFMSTIEEVLKSYLPDDRKLKSSVFFFVDMMQRHFHKKNNVMYHEVSSFLSEKTQSEIYNKILKT